MRLTMLASLKPNSNYRWLVVVVLFLLSACVSHNRAPVKDLERPPKVHWGSHKVKTGETLYSIAWRYGRDYRELARINGIRTPYLLQPGQRISLHATKRQVSSKKTSASAKAIPKKQSSENRASKATVPKQKTRSAKVITTPVNTAPKKVAVPGPVQWHWPLKGKIISTYSRWGANKGIDIAATKGTAVRAAAAGSVVYAGSGLIGYGNLVIIKHSETYLSAYAHNSRILVTEKNNVKAGDKIAEIGSTGTNKLMLHFEIRKNGKPVNPLHYLPK